MESSGHVPVLCTALADWIAPAVRQVWVDCTVGLAGHAVALMGRVPADARLVALDADPGNLARAAVRLTAWSARVRLLAANFRRLDVVLSELGIETVDAVVADLGVSSNQLDDASRGLSFDVDGPLDMRLDPGLTTTAADLVNGLSESRLADLLYVESQEHHSRRIAKRICQARRESRITRTVQLARIVAGAVGGRRGRLHPATKTFLALRRAVNDEGGALAELLATAERRLSPGGRMAVISFHSGEDRCVKEAFRDGARRGVYRMLTRTPIVPDPAECRANPRARSAKLRVVERTDAGLPNPHGMR